MKITLVIELNSLKIINSVINSMIVCHYRFNSCICIPSWHLIKSNRMFVCHALFPLCS